MKSRPFFIDAKKEAMLEESILVAEAVFALAVSTEIKKRVFDSTTWFVSERYGKYATRYRTRASLTQTRGLRHDHVFPRKDLWFIVQRAASVRDTLSLCIGCVVTGDEHKLLADAEKTHNESYGWLRYCNAGIEVVDRVTDTVMTPDMLATMSEQFIKLYRASRFIAIEGDLTAEQGDI